MSFRCVSFALVSVWALLYACNDGSCPPGTTKIGGSCMVPDSGADATLDAETDGGADAVADTLDAPVDDTPPEVVRVEPTHLAEDVPLDTVIRVVFSERIDPSTLTGASLSVSESGAPVAGALEYDDGTLTATFTPTSDLALRAEYEISVPPTIMDLAGNMLETETRVLFTTRDGSWGGAERLETRTDPAHEIAVAADAEGAVVAVWRQDDGTRANLWFSRFAEAWGAPALFESSTEDPYGTVLRRHPSGDVFAVWAQDGIRTTRYDADSGAWDLPQLLSMSTNVGGQRMAFAPGGTGVVVWLDLSGGVFSSSFDPDTGWTTETEISDAGAGGGLAADVAMDADGNAFAVWEEHDGARFNVESNRLSSDGWASAIRIESASGDARTPRIAAAGDGTAMAVWAQLLGVSFDIRAASYTSAWTSAESLESTAQQAFFPVIVVEAEGVFSAAWEVDDPDEIWVRRYDGSWGASQRLGTGSGVRLLTDARGNVMAIWRQFDGTVTNLVSSRRTEPGVWEPPVLVSASVDSSVTSFDVTVDDAGHISAGFIAGEDVWAVRLE